MKKYLLICLSLLLLAACKNLEDAELSNRKTFIKFFNGPHNFTAASFEITTSGYLIVGNMRVSDTRTIATIIETDFEGNRMGELHTIEGITAKSIKPVMSSGSISGYILVGDSIRVDPSALEGANIEITSLKVLKLSPSFQTTARYVRTDRTSSAIKEDYFGHAVTITDDNKIFVLGGVKDGVQSQQTAPENSYLIEFNNTLDSIWSIKYPILDRTYQNSKSIIYKNGILVWASGLAVDQGGFNTSWVVIPVIEANSTFINYNPIGQNTEQLFVPFDITPAHYSAFGYGVVGTYSKETNGSKGNMFFFRTNSKGDILHETLRFFDGQSGVAPLTDATLSNTLDGGTSITSTLDGGFVLAGITSLSTGNAKDIWLIKIDAFGTPVWSKTFGGAGDQIPATIRELPSGDLLICGTNTVGGFSSLFLIKTTPNGEIKD